MRLGLDPRRAFLEGDALDGRAARHAQRLHGAVDAVGDGLRGVGVDDEDAFGGGHGARMASKLLFNNG
jgi:hypothetical protein